MDAAGKDSTIKHVMSGINPQGCQVHSFKAPSTEELNHDYLWRCSKALPERGRIGIFNRSYYEEILVTRVHPEILEQRPLPMSIIDNNIWERRLKKSTILRSIWLIMGRSSSSFSQCIERGAKRTFFRTD